MVRLFALFCCETFLKGDFVLRQRMELTPVKFLSLFLAISSVGWILFSFAAKLLGWFLSKTTGALVSFRFAGLNCLKDISVQSEKGALKCLTIGELRLKLIKPFRAGLNITTWDLKLQLSLCDVEIVLSKPAPVPGRSEKPKMHARKSSSTGRGKWKVFVNVAKYLKLSASEILIKVSEIPKASLEMKAFHLDMFKGDTLGLSLGIKLTLMPCILLLGNEVTTCERSSISRFRQTLLSVGRAPEADSNMMHTICSLEHFVLTSNIEHYREAGMTVSQVNATCGDTFVNLSECMSLRNAISTSSASSTQPDKTNQSQPAAYEKLNEHSDDASDSGKVGVGEIVDDKRVMEAMVSKTEKDGVAVVKPFLKKFPQRVELNLPKLRIRCSHPEEDAVLDNEITGLHLKSSVLMHSEESSDIFSQLDVQLECGEIHVFRENFQSLIEIMKVAVVALFEFPVQLSALIRAEVDVRLGGTRCNILTNKFEKWMQLTTFKTVKSELNDVDGSMYILKEKKKPKQRIGQLFCWVCSVSAPDMAVVVYSLDGLALFHVSSQTSHLYINSVSGQGGGIHIEVGELYVTMDDEEQELFKHYLSGAETVPGCVVHIVRAAIDWGLLDVNEEDSKQKRLTCVTEIGDVEIFLSMPCLRALIYSGIALENCAKLFRVKKPGRGVKQGKLGNKKIAKGMRCLKIHLEGLSMEFCDRLQVESMLVPDPKKVNFGNQGGEVVITKMHDGKLRTASVKVISFNGTTLLGAKCGLVIALPTLNLFVDRDKDITQLDVEHGKVVYQELDRKNVVIVERSLVGLQNVKFLLKPARVADEMKKHSIFSATEIAVWWEPDVHLFFNRMGLQLKQLVEMYKNAHARLANMDELVSDVKTFVKDKSTSSQTQSAVKQSWWKTALAVDIEVLQIRAELADGVQGAICFQSIFSEDAEVGILFEDIEVSLNNAILLRNERLQISRVPVFDHDLANIEKNSSTTKSDAWDCIIQGSGTHLIMPYRLQLRAIDDAVEDTWRGLKLALAAQAKTVFPEPQTTISKAKKERSMRFSSIRLHLLDIAAEIEEEPIQSWLDEHQRILRKVKRESLLRERLLEEAVQELNAKGKTLISNSEKEHALMSGQDKLREEKYKDLDIKEADKRLHQQTFQAYRDACAKLVAYKGSGACSGSFQEGFCPSRNRGSLFSVHASNLDVTLTEIDGGRNGMIDSIRKLDCVTPETNVPFSRVLGGQIDVSTSSLTVQLRDYPSPILAAMGGKCKGIVIFAQQATCFPKQMIQELYIGRWRKVGMLRSISGSTPSWKMYSELPISFHTARVSFGVGYEPAIADVSYAFTVALRRANLSVRKAVESEKEDSKGSASLNSSSSASSDPGGNMVKKERSLPWWDDMRYYIHGRNSIDAAYFEWSFLASTDPYENVNMMRIYARPMIIQQSEGRLTFSGRDFDLHVSSTEAFALGPSLDLKEQSEFIHTPIFVLEITMDWDCCSREPNNHYLHAFPNELKPRQKMYDLFRSTSLALSWKFSLKTDTPEPTDFDTPCHVKNREGVQEKLEQITHCISRKVASQQIFPEANSAKQSGRHEAKEDNMEDRILPSMNVGAHDLIWIFKWWSLMFSPPHKLRSFSRWPRFGITRLPRSGNLSLDKVLTEFILRVDATPACIKHVSLMDDDPAEGLTFNMRQLRYELCYSRGRQHYTFDSKRDLLELVYQGVDVYSLLAQLDRSSKIDDNIEQLQKSDKVKQLLGFTNVLDDESSQDFRRPIVTLKEHGFLFTTECFTVRKQAPKADPTRLSSWRDNVRVQARPKCTTVPESGSESESEPVLSDPSDDESYNVVLADNCLRVSLYGLKLFWTILNRDAVWAWVGDISRAFESPKPSPSKQYAQRKMMEKKQKAAEQEVQQSDISKLVQSSMSESTSHVQPDVKEHSKDSKDSSEEEGTLQFMVNVIQPQFNLHSEEAHGRFLLAAASGRVLARSFHSIYYVGLEMIEQALGCKDIPQNGDLPQISWKRRELSVLLEHVQAHVAPTDVDPGAGLQWLPRIPREAPKVKRTGALLERVFMPCTMYFQYTRHKGGTTDCKVKPLKELSFNSPNIAATMTSCQFHIMVDVISTLLLARLPKPRRNNFLAYGEKDEVIEEEADEVVPDGVEEVEQARIKLEETQRECKLLFDDLRAIKLLESVSRRGLSQDDNLSYYQDGALWMISSKTSALILRLEAEFATKRQERKAACVSLRLSLKDALKQRLREKEKNKSPSAAMRISWAIDKVVWSMLSDGESFAEAEISNMILNVDRHFDDIGVARFTIKYFVVKNCLPNAKSDVVLSAWNPPNEWGRNVMLRVDARQGTQNEGSSPLELFQVEIYPLKIHLTEMMYTMMWEYLFPEEENDIQKRQEVWRIPSAATGRRSRKGSSGLVETVAAQSVLPDVRRENENILQPSFPGTPLRPYRLHYREDISHIGIALAARDLDATRVEQLNMGNFNNMESEHRRSLSFDRTWEENEADFLTNEIALKSHSSNLLSSSRRQAFTSSNELQIRPQVASDIGPDVTSTKPKDSRKPAAKGSKASSQEERKEPVTKKSSLVFYNIKISQVELLVNYEGRFPVSDLRLLMDTFARTEFVGSWRRLFSRVKKHIIWSVLKSVAGMQGKKFKNKLQGHGQVGGESDSNSSDSCTSTICNKERFLLPQFKRQSDRAGEGFVSSIKGLFSLQRRKAKALVRRTMRGEGSFEFQKDWSDGEADIAQFSRQLSISKAKQLLRRHTKKFRSISRQKGVILLGDRYRSSPRSSPYYSEAESSSATSAYEDFND